MIGKAGNGWQTTTADLALILFLVVSASAAHGGPNAASANARAPETAAAPSTEANPSTAVYHETAGTSLPQWLATQAVDERQAATVLVTRARAGPSPVMERGIAFLDQIEAAGRAGRLVVERGSSDDVTVVLAYDRTQDSGMALAAR